MSNRCSIAAKRRLIRRNTLEISIQFSHAKFGTLIAFFTNHFLSRVVRDGSCEMQSMLTARQSILETIRQRLRGHRQMILKRLSAQSIDVGDVPQHSVELADELRETEHHLEMLRTDRFGLCRICGNEIAAERLEVLPFSDVCICCLLSDCSEKAAVEEPLG